MCSVLEGDGKGKKQNRMEGIKTAGECGKQVVVSVLKRVVRVSLPEEKQRPEGSGVS